MFCRIQIFHLITLVILLSLVHSEKGTKALHHREKRWGWWLSWPVNGGSCKVVFSILVPVQLGKFQSFGWAINIQAQYAIPAQLIYWVDKFKQRNMREVDITSDSNMPASRLVKKYSRYDDDVKGDDSRQMLYLMIESVMFRHRKNGTSCLLRTICGLADAPLPKENGLLGEVVNLIFTPSKKEKLDQKYYDAYEAGKWGADCLNLYPNCPHGDGIFDKILF